MTVIFITEIIKFFKTKNTSYSSKNISNKLKTQNLFFKNNNINKHSTKNLYINKDNILNNNHNSNPRFQKEITRNIIKTKYFILLEGLKISNK